MISAHIRRFAKDDAGATLVLGLFWFLLFVAFAGLAVDTTNGFRNKTMLQATADAAALAAVIDLPRGDNAIASGLAYAEKNLPSDSHGHVVELEDIEVGRWDGAARTFSPLPATSSPEPGAEPDAVHVRVRMTFARGNPVLANFLRIVGVTGWSIEAQAIAQRFIPQCLKDGLVARGFVDTSGNNSYFNNFCVHGQMGVLMQNGNTFELGTSVSMLDLSTLSISSDGLRQNPGLEDALREGNLDPRMVDHVPEIMEMLLDPTSPIQPIYIDQSRPVRQVDCSFKIGESVPGTIYHVVCPANKLIQIPGGVPIRGIVVVAESQIKIPANSILEDVVLASRATTSNQGANIHFSSGANLGREDDCADGGGVQIFTTQNLFFSSSVTYNGVQVVSARNVELGTSDEGVKGLSVQAGGNITLSSNNRFGLCDGEDPLLTSQYYRLVL